MYTRILAILTGTSFFVAALTACGNDKATESKPAAEASASPNPMAQRGMPCTTLDCMNKQRADRAAAAAAEQNAQLQASAAAGPKPDFGTPDASYLVLAGNYDAGALRQAFGEKLLADDIPRYLGDVAWEQDAFKKAEKSKKAVADFEARAAQLSSNRYVVLKNVSLTVQPYNVGARTFSLKGFESGSHFSMGNRGGNSAFEASLVIVDGDAFSSWLVEDEPVARKIESDRAGYRLEAAADLYMFIVGPTLGRPDGINVSLTKVVIKDGSGNVLGTVGPATQVR